MLSTDRRAISSAFCIASLAFALALGALLTGCVTWNRDIEVLRLTHETSVNLDVPRAGTHTASRLDLCVALAPGYKQDAKNQAFVDAKGGTSKVVAKGRRNAELIPIAGRYYVGQNLVCFMVADDRSGTPFSSIELSSSNAEPRPSRVYWNWGHYL